MPQNPDWLLKLVSEEREAPVIRGLNLALRLADPAKLPLMLWDIAAAQPRIDQAIRELSFLHFARFVPSWDGRALMVVTEFDGPIEDYVLDFAIVIGDVFDRLLSYVDPPPRWSVRDNPSAFLRYVRQWNRVPYGPRRLDGSPALLPSRMDYPIYKAYPDKTVLDIHADRQLALLHAPVVDGPAEVVALEDVQGNILKGYGARRSLHLFLKVEDADKARTWLATEFTQDESPWGGVQDAQPWPDLPGAQQQKPPLAANVGFTHVGLQVLLPGRGKDLADFPTAFREGADVRAHDNGDVGDSAPDRWYFGRDAQDIDVVISLADIAAGRPVFSRVRKALIAACESHGFKIVHSQLAGSVRRFKPFGYAEGIAEPRIAGLASGPSTFRSDADRQPAASVGEFLLGARYASIYGGPSLRGLSAELAENGSFGVMRLMELHEDNFQATVTEASRHCQRSEDYIKAKLMGRWPEGRPLALDDPGHTPKIKSARNDFDYAPSWAYPDTADDRAGARCPLGAHIRRVTPRSSDAPGLRHSRRILRRGMPTRWREGGTRKTGLLGLFFCANLERQFEFMQRHWIQGSARSGLRGAQDPIAGVRQGATRFELTPNPGNQVIEVPPLVTTRGTLYLFYPGLNALTRMANAPHAAAPTPAPAWRPLPALLQRAQRRLLTAPTRARNALILETLGRILDEQRLEQWRPRLEKWIPQLLPTRFRHTPDANRVFDIATDSPAFIAEPFETAFKSLLEQKRSVGWVQQHRAYWVLAHADVKAVLGAPHQYLQSPSDARVRGVIRQDGDKHTRVQAAVVQAFEIAAKPMKHYINDAIGEVLPRLQRLHQFDFVREFALPVPRRVFWRFFGLPAVEVEACDRQAQAMMRYYRLPSPLWAGSRTAYADATLRLAAQLTRALVKAWIAEQLPGDRSPFSGTLVGEIAARTRIDLGELPIELPIPPQLLRLQFPRQERPLAFVEAIAVLVQVVLAGYMSPQFLLGSAMLNFLRPDPRPERRGETPWRQFQAAEPDDHGTPWSAPQQAAVREQRLKKALQEALRFDPPVAIVERYTAADLTVGEATKLPKDCPVYVVLAAANKDPACAPDLEQFHWDRDADATPHLSLGHGIHQCIGRAMQGEISLAAFKALLQAFPDLVLCHPDAVPAWMNNIYFRGLLTLPVMRTVKL